MARTDVVTPSTLERISLDGRVVEYRVIRSDNGKKLRIRVGPHGVEVVQPVTRSGDEVEAFLVGNARWIVEQVRRAERLRNVTMNTLKDSGEILFRGEPTRRPSAINNIAVEQQHRACRRWRNSRVSELCFEDASLSEP